MKQRPPKQGLMKINSPGTICGLALALVLPFTLASCGRKDEYDATAASIDADLSISGQEQEMSVPSPNGKYQ